jgi:hypothetical protein
MPPAKHAVASVDGGIHFFLPSAARFGLVARIMCQACGVKRCAQANRAGPVSIDRSIAALDTAGIIPAAAALGLLNLLLMGP